MRKVDHVMGETESTERKVRPLDPVGAGTHPRRFRGRVVIVVVAFGGLAVLPFVAGTEDRPEAVAVSSLASTATQAPDSVPDSSTRRGVTSPAGVDLPRVGGSFGSFENVPVDLVGGASVVWTGQEIIVWGGQPVAGVDPTCGAAFDPATGAWRGIEAPPWGSRFGHLAVWTGDRMIVWGGSVLVDVDGRLRHRATAAGAVYDPKLDQWTRVPDAPIGQLQQPVALWTGREMIILGAKAIRLGAEESNEAISLPAAAFNPDTGSWRLLPELPVTPGPFGPGPVAAVWAGDAVVASGAAIGDDTVAVYRPDSDEWETLNIPMGPRSGHTMVWTGTEVIIWGGSPRDSELPVGLALNPDTSEWRALPPPPVTERAGHGAAWTGTGLLMWGGTIVRPLGNTPERLSFGVLHNPQSDQWILVDAPDSPGDALGPAAFRIVWLGNAALLWNQIPEQSGILTLDPVESPGFAARGGVAMRRR